MQAYPGTDGVVISITHKECEDMVTLHQHLYEGSEPVLAGLPKTHPYAQMMDAICELKEDV